MKKILVLLMLLVLLVGCNETVTIITDQDGNVLETKSSSKNNFIHTNEYLKVKDNPDMKIYEHTDTGCQYAYAANRMSAIYNEYGQVKGCRKNPKIEE